MRNSYCHLFKSILIFMIAGIFLFAGSIVAFAGCDLIVTDISWTPANPASGTEVTFKATIKNQGTSATPSGVIHGVLFQVDGVSVNWSDNYTSSLAAGASTTVTATWGPYGKGTWTATNGNHTIRAYVDDVNRIAEDNESNNNTYTEPLNIGCDLIVTDISWTPANPAVGNEVTFKATIKNQGTQASPAGVIHGVLFQVDGVSVNWSDNYTSSLAAGASTTVTATWGPNGKGTWTATGGTHTVLAYVDDVNRITEVNEGNNTYSEQFTPGTAPTATPTPTPTPTPKPTATPMPTPTPGGFYEAELGTLSGGAVVATDHTGYTGAGFVAGYIDTNKGTAATQINLIASSAGNYNVTLRYSNGTGSTKTLSLYVNGIKIKQISLPATANWDTWTTRVETVTLNLGSNTVTYKFDTTDSGNVNLDNITLNYVGPTPTPISTPTATPTPTAGPTPTPVPGGAFVEYEAENGTYTGALRGPGTTYRTVESESSGRKYVSLSATGQYVQWTLTQPANAIVIRYNIPDAPGGGGITANLSFYVNGSHNRDISLTSKYAWVYGGYPWDNNPANGNPHRFYDETRVLLGTTLPAGTVIKLQKDSGDTAAYYNIDLIDMENVGPPLTQPANSLSITSYGAVPDDAYDDTAAFNSVVSAAKSQGKSVWLPAGTFILNSRPNSFSGVTIYGAGMWYTVLSGIGVSFSPNGSNCRFYDFAMFGNTTQRIDSALEAGFDGNFGTGSVIQNIWMEHLKVGVWANYGTDGLLIKGCRIRNVFADGVNLYNGTRNSTVQDCHFRNTGDDSIAIWSGSGNACTGNTIQWNTVQSPYHANAIAVYGGSGNSVKNNYCYDTVQFGSGVYLANRFGVVPFSGTTTVSDNTLIRCGSWDNDYSLPWGAIKLGAEESNMSGTFTISNNTISNSLYCGILIIGPNSCNGATFSNININNCGTYGIEIRNNARGSATFNYVVVSGAASGGLNNAAGSNFTITKGPGNSGW